MSKQVAYVMHTDRGKFRLIDIIPHDFDPVNVALNIHLRQIEAAVCGLQLADVVLYRDIDTIKSIVRSK